MHKQTTENIKIKKEPENKQKERKKKEREQIFKTNLKQSEHE